MFQLVVVLVVLSLIGSIAFLVWWFSPDQRARRAMKSVPRRHVAEVVDGEKARVVGEVVPERTIAAPLSGRACVAWRVLVQERRSTGKNSRWVILVDEHEAVDFFLRDGLPRGPRADKALVKTSFIHPVLERDGNFTSGLLNDASPELEAFLAERGHSSKGWVFNKQMRYREGVVEPGETVAVVGTGRWERDPDERATAGEGYRQAQMPERLVIDSPEDGPLLLSDEPGTMG